MQRVRVGGGLGEQDRPKALVSPKRHGMATCYWSRAGSGMGGGPGRWRSCCESMIIDKPPIRSGPLSLARGWGRGEAPAACFKGVHRPLLHGDGTRSRSGQRRGIDQPGPPLKPSSDLKQLGPLREYRCPARSARRDAADTVGALGSWRRRRRRRRCGDGRVQVQVWCRNESCLTGLVHIKADLLNCKPRSDSAFAEVTCRACRVFFMNGTCRSMHAQSNKSSRLHNCLNIEMHASFAVVQFCPKKKERPVIVSPCYVTRTPHPARPPPPITTSHRTRKPRSQDLARSVAPASTSTPAHALVSHGPYPPTSGQTDHRVLNFDDGQTVSRVRRRRVATMLQRDPP